MKKILLILLLLLCSCTSVTKPEYPYEVENTKVDMSEYSGVSSTNHNFRLIKVSELFKCIDEKSSGVFYLGRENCHCCQQIVRYLNEAAQELNVTVYYIDVFDEDEPLTDQTRQDKLFEYLYDILGTNEEGERVLLTPHVFSVVNGQFYGSQICFDNLQFSDVPTEKEIKKLKDVYKKIMKPFAQ